MEQRFVGRYITKGRYVSVHLWFAWGNSVSSSQNDDVGSGQGSSKRVREREREREQKQNEGESLREVRWRENPKERDLSQERFLSDSLLCVLAEN